MSEPAAEPTPEDEDVPFEEPAPAPEPTGAPLPDAGPAEDPTDARSTSAPPAAPSSTATGADSTTSTEGTSVGAPTDEPTQAVGLGPKEIDRLYAKFDTYREQHAERVERILGEQFQHAVLCPLCSHFAPGYINLVDVPEEAVATMRQVLGMPDLSNFAADPDASACPTCQGKGETLTGSSVPNQETRTCPKCMGKGWVGTPSVAVTATPNGEPQPVLTGPLHVAVELDDPAVALLRERGYTVFKTPTMPAA